MDRMVSVLGDKRVGRPRRDVVPWIYLVAFLVGTALVVGFMWYHIGNERRVALDHWRARLSTFADDRARSSELLRRALGRGRAQHAARRALRPEPAEARRGERGCRAVRHMPVVGRQHPGAGRDQHGGHAGILAAPFSRRGS